MFRLKFSIRKFTYLMILFFPFIAVLFATINNGDGMNTLSFVYSSGIGLCTIAHKKSIPKKDTLILVLALFIILLGFFRENESTYYWAFQFFNCIFAYIYYSSKYFDIKGFARYATKNEKKTYALSIGIYGLLIFSYITTGLYYVSFWATRTFKGPFNIPHTLAYIFFFMTLHDIFCFYKLNENKYLILVAINIIITLFTAVRSVLMPLFFILLYFVIKIFGGKSSRKKLVISIAILTLLFVALESNAAAFVITKSRYALVVGGDITNSRWKIFENSIQALWKTPSSLEYNTVIGIGIKKLFEFNQSRLYFAIHAHSDFIDALVAYGILGLLIYCISFGKFIKKKKFWEGVTIALLAGFNGLFPYGESVPLIIYCRVFFELLDAKN